MKILFLCGYFSESVEKQITKDSSSGIQYAANKFQKNIICGLRENRIEMEVLSTPFIAPYPQGYKKVFFAPPPPEKSPTTINYAGFCNIWGIRNISRRYAIRKAITAFTKEKSDEKVILVYSLHTPFLKAAVEAKLRNPELTLCVIVPDLPQYMRLDSSSHPFYSIAKKIDIFFQNRLLKKFDFFVLLTQEMATHLKIEDERYTIIEGIADLTSKKMPNNLSGKYTKKVCLYAGGIQTSYGVPMLCEAFMNANIPNAELHLYGRGDYEEELIRICQTTPTIKYLGTTTNSKILEEETKATILINPRPTHGEFTKYSFPSKNIEYMASGTPLLTTKLPGMPKEYYKYVYTINEETAHGLSSTLKQLFLKPKEILHEKGIAAKEFILSKKNYVQQTRRIIDLLTSREKLQ